MGPIPREDYFSDFQHSLFACSSLSSNGPCEVSPFHISKSAGVVLLRSCLGSRAVEVL